MWNSRFLASADVGVGYPNFPIAPDSRVLKSSHFISFNNDLIAQMLVI